MWDNGAFSHYRAGGVLDHIAFQNWVEPRLGHPHWAVIPDVIDGTVEQNRQLLKQWSLPPFLSAPVWHMGLPIDWLLEIADNWPRFCFGSSGAYWQVGSERWKSRTDVAWNALENHGHKPWVHLLRGLAICGCEWPFASADSVNVAVSYARNGEKPIDMIRRIDAKQSPIKWDIVPVQQTMQL